MSTSSDPEAIRADIERTRRNLSDDVDDLTYEASPSTQVHRQVDRVKGSARSRTTAVREKVMGSTHSGRSTSSAVKDAAGGAQDAAAEHTRGNPLAAGLIAFGVGWLAGSLLPSSEREQQAAQQAKASAQPVVQDLADSAKQAAQDLKEPAQQAAQSVKDRAGEAGQQVKGEGTSAAQDLKDQAHGSAEQVRASRS